MKGRQVFDLGGALAVLQPDEEGQTTVCLVQPGGNDGPAQEVWIFGKANIRVLGELALAAQRFQEPQPVAQAQTALKMEIPRCRLQPDWECTTACINSGICERIRQTAQEQSKSLFHPIDTDGKSE